MELEQTETFCCEETTRYSVQIPTWEIKKEIEHKKHSFYM